MTTGTHRARKRFGQNFLTDQAVIGRIIAAIGLQSTDKVVEIGPGQAALTRHLAAGCKQLTVIELDRDLAQRLRTDTSLQAITVVQADALQVNLSDLFSERFRLVGNLPYNISTPLLFQFFAYVNAWQDAHVMLQKEVAQRLVAVPETKNYGRLAVMTQVQCRSELLFEIPPEAFDPAPRVTSSMVRLVPLQKPLVATAQIDQFSGFIKSAFAQQRKTIANNLKGKLTVEQIESANVHPMQRPQQLDIQALIRLYNHAVGKSVNDTASESYIQ